MSAWPTTVDYFQDITYTITLNNTGNAAATVKLTNVLSLPYQDSSATGGIWWDETANAMKWEGSLAANEARVFTFRVQGPNPIVPHNTTFVNEVIIEDGIHAPIVRSVPIIANPRATDTPTSF
jgi:uncharacterized repeat protein (TIGR01451 family)